MAKPIIKSITAPLSLITTREINNLWFADLEVRQDDYLQPECYVEFDDELYICKKIEKIKSRGKFTYRARLNHLMDELNDFSIESFRYNNISAEIALANVLSGTTWSVGNVDDLGLEDIYSDNRITVLAAINLILKAFGGELYFNQDRTVDLQSAIGNSTKKLQIRYDKNCDYIEPEEDPSKLVTRLFPYGEDNITINTLIMEACDAVADWTSSDEDNLVKSPDSVDRKQGSASVKLTAKATDSLNDTLIRDLGAGAELNLTGYTKLKFWIKASRTGTNIQFGMGESTWNDNTTDINITTADKWIEFSWDISGIANADKNAIRYIGLKITNASAENEIRFDYIRAFNGEIYLESANLSKYKNPKEDALFTSFSDVTELKAYGQEYLDIYDKPIYTYKINIADLSILPKWSDEVINLGDTVRVYDADLKLNIDCRVKKIVKDVLNPAKLQLELTNSVENVAQSLADYYSKLGNAMPFDNDKTAINAGSVKFGYLRASVLRAGSIFASHYGQLRNVLPFNFDDSLDDTHFLECEFYMPKNVDEIKSCWVHIVGRNFRAYSKGASGGGSHSHSVTAKTSTGGTAHKHTVTGGTAANSGNHSHTIYFNERSTYDTSPSPPDVAGLSGTTDLHSHTSGTYKAENHSHHYLMSQTQTAVLGTHFHSLTGITSVNESAHTHDVSGQTASAVGTHTHNLTFGIYEGTNLDGVNVYVADNGEYSGSVASDNAPVEINVNIASSLTAKQGWKKIKITSSNLGRVIICAMLDLTLSSI